MFTHLSLATWRRFCRLVIKIFYRHYEVAGLENIPTDGGIIFCANHVNALVDPILVQAACKKTMRPLARSGLFEKTWMKPILKLIGAVPIYRTEDDNSDPSHNEDSFRRVYELLEENEWIMIFPEGQSHTDSRLNQLKTGAARMALGTLKRGKTVPVLLPVGLTFTKKGKFRGDVLVYFGTPVDLTIPGDIEQFEQAKLITRRLSEGMEDVTVNTDNWEDMELVSKIDRFFSMRYGKYRQRNLTQRFKVLKRIILRHQLLRKEQPGLVEQVTSDLRRFESVCQSLGIKDYHLNVAYRPFVVILYCLRLLLILLVAVPVSFWAILNCAIPFYLTRHMTKMFASDIDQHETTKILLGLFWFSVFWGIQIYLVYQYTNLNIMLLYSISLVISAVTALKMRNDIFSIKENIYVFLLFIRKHGLKEHLINRRENIEKELAGLAKIANRITKKQADLDSYQ